MIHMVYAIIEIKRMCGCFAKVKFKGLRPHKLWNMWFNLTQNKEHYYYSLTCCESLKKKNKSLLKCKHAWSHEQIEELDVGVVQKPRPKEKVFCIK